MRKKVDIKEVTRGVLGTITDLLLWYTYLAGASIGKVGSRGVYQAFQEADQALKEVNHRTLATAWHKLLKQGFIEQKKRKNLFCAEITKFGKSALSQKIPTYHKNRPWDYKIYLITYDISEQYHKKRDLFRLFLKRIHCKRFQESVWITPYNPRQLIHEFIANNKIEETIVVSDMGKDGGIGETTIQNLLSQLYELDVLNDRYAALIKRLQSKQLSAKNLIFEYLSILTDDPQLPFELLPTNWLGEKAYQIVEHLKEKYILSFRGRESNRV